MFSEELTVLVAACNFLSFELGAQPELRKYLRERYMDLVTVSTVPTEKGNRELDVFHRSFRVKRLKGIPRDKFVDDLWLDIEACERSELIKVAIDDKNFSEYTKNDLQQYYYDNHNDDFQQWGTLYKEVIRILLDKVLLAELQKQLRKDLVKRAHEYVIAKSCDRFGRLLMAPPFLKDGQTPCVVAFVIGTGPDGQRTMTAAALNEHGDLKEYKVFYHLTWEERQSPAVLRHKPAHDAEVDECRELLRKHKAGLLVVGANCLDANKLKAKLLDVASSLDEEPWTVFGSTDVPLIFANSEKARTEFPNHSVFLRQAISLGRFQQSPISEVLSLWNEDPHSNLVLSMNLHPMQKEVPREKLVEALRVRAI